MDDYTRTSMGMKVRGRRRGRRGRRGPLMIIISILDRLDESDMNKTSLSYKTNLDIRVLNRYLRFLGERGLVLYSDIVYGTHARANDPTLVRITDKGREVLFHFKEAIRLMDERCDLRDRCVLHRYQ
ncbi:MAG: winged helix-turn-helix domain-containing protein [Candidatus Nitrosocaldus sp.]|nr:winged helix-turn-helix domain-containing protein [Candidatus Nitrosocaldus sp.]MDW8274780.1 winged helix-turn-helix domain-containing protein [Candidatus Nitrosocaldus sp.]